MPRRDFRLAAAVWLAGLCSVIGQAKSPEEWLVVAGFAAVCSAPLLWRSVAPLRVVAAIGALGLIGLLLPTSSLLDGPFLVALALAIGTAGASCHGWRPLVVIAAVILPSLVVDICQTTDVNGSVVTVGWLAFAFTTGRAIGLRRSYLAVRAESLRLERARELEREIVAERLAIARDLHDVVAQSVETVSIQATVGLHLFDSDPDAGREALLRIRAASTSTSRSIREMLGVMRAPDQERDRPAGLEELADLVAAARTETCSTAFSVSGEPRDVDSSIGPALYRIVHEALTNARRHAHASIITVELAWRPDEIVVTVADDGIGASPDSTEGYGRRGMRERLTLIGGRLEIDTAAQRGFLVRAIVPTEAAP